MSRIRQAFHLAQLGIRTRVVTGIAVIVPLAITVWVVRFLFLRIDGLLQPILVQFLGQRIPGVGLLATLLLLYLVGLLVQNLGGRTLLYWAERVLLRLPFLKDVYGSSKTIMETFTNPEGVGFKRVVSFEYPRAGCRAFGFVTNDVVLPDGSREIAVFLPTTPNPTSGYLLFLPAEEVEETTMSVDEAIKMIVSGGVLLPRAYAVMVPKARSLGGRTGPVAAPIPPGAGRESAVAVGSDPVDRAASDSASTGVDPRGGGEASDGDAGAGPVVTPDTKA